MNINAAFVLKYLLNTYSGVFEDKHTKISSLYLLQIKSAIKIRNHQGSMTFISWTNAL